MPQTQRHVPLCTRYLQLSVILSMIIWVTGCGSRQMTVKPYMSGVARGILYHLPRTQLQVDFVIAEHRFTPGRLVDYAPRYLGEQYRTEAETRYTIERVVLYGTSVPDEEHTFVIESQALSSADQAISLTPDGILYSINGRAYTRSEHNLLSDLPSPSLSPTRSHTLPQDYALATSRAKQAEIAAQRLFEIRERRLELLSGQVETMPCDGPALQMVIAGLDEEIAALEEMFAGTSEIQYQVRSLTIDIEEPIQDQLIARFAPQYGLVDKEDLSGHPLRLTIEEEERYAAPDAKSIKALKKSKGLRYLQPGRARITLTLPAPLHPVKLSLPIAQWGRMHSLERKLGVERDGSLPYSLYFDPTSGALETIARP